MPRIRSQMNVAACSIGDLRARVHETKADLQIGMYMTERTHTYTAIGKLMERHHLRVASSELKKAEMLAAGGHEVNTILKKQTAVSSTLRDLYIEMAEKTKRSGYLPGFLRRHAENHYRVKAELFHGRAELAHMLRGKRAKNGNGSNIPNNA